MNIAGDSELRDGTKKHEHVPFKLDPDIARQVKAGVHLIATTIGFSVTICAFLYLLINLTDDWAKLVAAGMLAVFMIVYSLSGWEYFKD